MNDLRPVHFSEIADTLSGKRVDVHQALGSQLRPCTPKELAGKMGWDVTSVRPRLTELRQAGLVETTGDRRNGEHVFRFVSLAEAQRRAAPKQETQLTLA